MEQVLVYRKPKEDFSAFLRQCRRAVNKLYGRNIKVDEDFWSMKTSEGLTFWESLKEYGRLSYNEGDDSYTIAVDFEFGRIVYAEGVWEVVR